MTKHLTNLLRILPVPFIAGCFQKSHNGHHPALEVCGQNLGWTGEGRIGAAEHAGTRKQREGQVPRAVGFSGSGVPHPTSLPSTPYDLSKLQGVFLPYKSADCSHFKFTTSISSGFWVAMDHSGLLRGPLPPISVQAELGQTGQDRPWVCTKDWVFTDTWTMASVHRSPEGWRLEVPTKFPDMGAQPSRMPEVPCPFSWGMGVGVGVGSPPLRSSRKGARLLRPSQPPSC